LIGMKEEKAVKAIIVKNGKFLVLKQYVEGKIFYTLPGGRIKSRNYKRELKREVEEETGIKIDVLKYVGQWHFVRKSNNVKTICRTYICKTVGRVKKRQESYEKIRQQKWLTKREFLSGKYSDNKTLLDLVKRFL